MPSMIQRRVGNTMVVVHNASVPTDAEWAVFMDECKQVDPSKVRILVFTDGGHPSTVQRKGFFSYIGSAQPPVAVVSEHLLVRGVVTAMSWFNARIVMFRPSAAAEAFAHVDLDAMESATVLRVAREMASRLDGGTPTALAGAGR
jgi:hypothetical protein